jgi:crotonobetainyl-CoA:carnitine CoA-transferase CaiB-like acyl-CoA transferase
MAGHLPLFGIKALDLTWAIAGPSATRVLADYGATVVRIESTRHIDGSRAVQPFYNGKAGPENSGLYQNVNTGKLGITLDIEKPAGRDVVRDLVCWADVVVESFSPRVMRSWGLDYEQLRRIKPEIIMLSTCLWGQTGPLSKFAGFGSLAQAMTGFTSLAGWPDREPAGPYGAYTDAVAPRFSVVAILAALDHRDRTGNGQYIDQSQAESAMQFLAPAILSYTADGRIESCDGNRDPAMAPHGVFPAAGEDRWVAIAVATDGQWRGLCSAMGWPGLADDPRFATTEGRLTRAEMLDGIVSNWTRGLDAREAEVALQSHGVPASAVHDSSDLYADPQLKHRGHWVEIEHPIHGQTVVESSRFRLSRTPAAIDRCAPTFGRDNEYVFSKLLGYSHERIAGLAEEGVLE